MSQTTLENQKLLIKAGLNYQIDQARKTLETTGVELDKKISNIIIEQSGNVLKQVDDLKSVTKARNWFRDISEGPVESGDVNYQIYLEQMTGLKVDLFDSLIKKVRKYLNAGKITTEGQYRQVELAIQLSMHQENPDPDIRALNTLLFTFQGKRKR